jgi:hypothetical protein
MISSLTISMLLLAAPPAYEPGPGIPQLMPENAGFSGGPLPAPMHSGSPGGGHMMGGPPLMDGSGMGSQFPGGPVPGGPSPFDSAGLGPGGAPGYCHTCTHFHGGNGCPTADWLFNPCNMYPHYPYWPKYGGYYYFRPYHMIRVAEQRDIAASWGEDPRNPYDHKVFDRVYEAIRAEESTEAETLSPSTTPAPSTTTPSTTTPPATIPPPPVPPSPMPPTFAPPTPVPSPEAPLTPPAPYAPQSSKSPQVIKVKPVSAKMRPSK